MRRQIAAIVSKIGNAAKVTIIKNFFNSQVNYDPTFVRILSEMLDHFVEGSENNYSNLDLTNAVQTHSRTQSYVNGFIDILKNYISEYKGNISEGRIEGAVKIESTWNIPIDAIKPTDKRVVKPDNNEFIINLDANYFNEVDNLIYLLENVIHMKLIEAYERKRHVFSNEDIEVVVDIYPFMIAIEVENKSLEKDPKTVILYYLNLLGLNIKDSYRLSWDDKYEELCLKQNIKQYNIVDNTKEMPKYLNHEFNLKN